jgi:mono/diheme cytochrome c family protein
MMTTGRWVNRLGLWTATAVAAAALVACGGGDSDEPAAEETAPPAAATEAAPGSSGGDTDALVMGLAPAEFYAANCAVCHGANREGGVGLALTPDLLTQEASVYEDVVMNGRSGTAMTSMGKNLGLSTEEVETLVHFLQTVEP